MELKPLVISELKPALNPTLVVDGAGLEKLKTFLANNPIIGWDKETTPIKDFFWRRDRTWQFGNLNEQYVIDLLAFADGDSDLLYNAQGYYGTKIHPKFLPVIEVCKPVMCTKDFLKVGVNLAFEYETTYWNWGLRSWNLFSCDIAERILQAGAHSLKDYAYFSMASMMERYFGVQISKELQESFDLKTPLTQDQVDYAALDTRLPLGLRNRILQSLQKFGLSEVTQIENNAIGSFVDMHVHGQRINTEQWKARTDKFKAKLDKVIFDELDPIFISIVGNKNDALNIDVEALEQEWKSLKTPDNAELELKIKVKKEKNLQLKAALMVSLESLTNGRKARIEIAKSKYTEAKKQRTKLTKMLDKCEGNALINYGSDDQMLEVLRTIKGLEKLTDTNDDTLVKFKDIPAVAALRNYRELSKQVNTYGYSWIQQWQTGPGKDEGWLHPGDGRLHSKFNQLDAETGRSTSSQPNDQNLPQDPEIRSCFIADPPDEQEPEGYVIVTADMSGAELRIIADESGAESWVEAFLRDEDVHSVGTELLYPDKWPLLTIPSVESPNGWAVDTKEKVKIVVNGKEKLISPCKYYGLRPNGQPAREKCDCPEHKKLRDNNKSTNFLLAYGGGAPTLAERIGVTNDEAQELMDLHRAKNPKVWAYLENSGKKARLTHESRDMFGRRRLFPEPTFALAKETLINLAQSDKNSRWEKCMRKSYPDCTWETGSKREIENYTLKYGKKPNKEEAFWLTHNPEPPSKQVISMMKGMSERIERQGKNQPIQGANATIAKLAMGCGYDTKEGKPFLWHTLPLYNAKLLGFVHDELIVQCPKRYGQIVADLIGDAFRRAAAEKMTKVIMKFDYHIAPYWQK